MISMNNRDRASYKLMILLGFTHVIGLQTSGFLSGVLSFQGAGLEFQVFNVIYFKNLVFCNTQTLIYVGGGVAVCEFFGFF